METSQYQCVGFIVKFIVSNFDSKVTNRSFEQFFSQKGRDEKFDIAEAGKGFGLNSFHLNNRTDQYCLEKLAFLLYGQQLYIKQNNIRIKSIPDECIYIGKYISCNLKYIYKKNLAAKDRYGLLWLNDEVFYKRLYFSVYDAIMTFKNN